MGTHPIFESDFDCLTKSAKNCIMQIRFNEAIVNVETTDELLNMVPSGKVLGSLARAGKVKGQTPKVDAEEKKKAKTGRAKRRMQYNRRFVNVVPTFGKKKGPNSNS